MAIISLNEFMNIQSDCYTIRLYNRDFPKEKRTMALVLHLNRDSDIWVLRTLTRVPNLRNLSKDKKNRLVNNRWWILNKVNFKTFSEAKLRIIEKANTLTYKGYKITGEVTSFYLPPW